MGDLPSRAPSGVRIAGDDYQHLVTWNEVLTALLPGSGVRTVTVEDADAAFIDDIVVRYEERPARYVQVKHTVDVATPVGTSWLMYRRGNGRSVLQKFYESWRDLGGGSERIEMELITDRQLEVSDPIIACYDAATERLTPLVGRESLSRAATRRRAEWADHVGASEADLVAMLDSLRLRAGRPPAAEVDRAALLMRLHGLAHDQDAVNSAITMIREWIKERWRELPLDDLQERVRRLPRHGNPWSLFVVEGIDDLDVPGTPAASVRFVDLYEGATSYDRRQLRDPSQWPAVFEALTRAADELRVADHRRVLVRGAMRLPMWFATGAALRHVRGFTVGVEQNGQLWASDEASAPTPVQVTPHDVGLGPDLAVIISVATDASDGARRYIETANLPVANLVHVVPVPAPGGEAVRNGHHAATMAVSVREAVRAVLLDSGADHVHLFLATPGGLALLLGHRWNAMAPTTLYEHLGGAAYAQAMTVPA